MSETPLDFFISYTRVDERWAEWIASELEDAGYQTRLMAWDFRPGENFVLQMHEAARTAARTIAVLSPAYVKSAYCAPEWAAALGLDPTGAGAKLLPVRVAECTPDGLLAQRVSIDLAGLAERPAAAKLLDGVKLGRAKPALKPSFPGAQPGRAASGPRKPVFPGGLPPIWTLPHPPNPFFTGREKLLELLHLRLTQGRTAAVTQPHAVHGLGGVGKTQVAVEYAYRFSAEYDAVLWVVADSPETLTVNLAGLTKPTALDLPESEAKEVSVQVQAVLAWLRRNPRWLLILDSADTPKAVHAICNLLPQDLGGHVLLTSRRSDWPPTISDFSAAPSPSTRKRLAPTTQR